MSEITLSLEHPSLGCGEIIARYDLSEIQEKAYQQGRADCLREAHRFADQESYKEGYKRGLEQGRADELDKITKMMLLGCDELECEKCDYRLYSEDVCQQAYTFEMLGKYIEEQLKSQDSTK